MAATCPVGFNVDKLRELVRAEYDRVAREPTGNFHFHRGPEYACRMLGYDPEELATIPAESTASFAGVGNPHRIGRIEQGETVLDIGCGAGLDLLLAARRAGPAGRAIGVDLTPSMLELARRAALKAGVWETVEVRRGMAEELPVASESVDVVISNGVLNLAPDKDRAFRERSRYIECCVPGAAYISPMSSFKGSFLLPHEAMSIFGRLESAALCRRQSFST